MHLQALMLQGEIQVASKLPLLSCLIHFHMPVFTLFYIALPGLQSPALCDREEVLLPPDRSRDPRHSLGGLGG